MDEKIDKTHFANDTSQNLKKIIIK